MATKTAKRRTKKTTKKKTGKQFIVRLKAHEAEHLEAIQAATGNATMNKAITHVLCNFQVLEEELVKERQENRSLRMQLEETNRMIDQHKSSFKNLMEWDTE